MVTASSLRGDTMKTKLFIIVVLFTTFLSAQWVANQTLNSQRYTFRKAFSVDPFHTWAAGDSGVIVFSRDRGRTWTLQNSGIKDQLNGIYFLDTAQGFAFGVKGGMLSTIDGGMIWQKVSTDDPLMSIRSMSFIDKQNGWFIASPGGGSVPLMYRTRNGGVSWSKETLSATVNTIVTKIQFADSMNGWLLSSKKIFRTTDGGNEWTVFDNNGNIYTTFRDLQFINAASGYFLIDQYQKVHLGRTINGGASWSIDSSFSPVSGASYAMHFLDSLNGSCIAASSVGFTTDAGVTWKLSKRTGLSTVCMIDPTTAIALGTFGTRMYSGDRGNSWNDFTPPTPMTLTKVKYQTEHIVWAIGGSSILLISEDQGANWRRVNIPSGIGFAGMTFPDSVNGWILDDSARIFHTVDRGKSWAVQSTGMNSGLKSIVFTDSLFGCTVGNNGTILRTTNGGNAWSPATKPASQHLFDVYFVDRDHGWGVGAGGTIIRASQSGTVWTIQTCPVSSALRSVSFSDTSNGTIVGDLGVVLRTTNGGGTWVQQPINNLLNYRGVKRLGSNGWFAGDSGRVYSSTDNGAEWKQQKTNTSSALNSVDFITASTGSIVGEGLIVLITKNGGVSSVYGDRSEYHPNSFTLENNYPNPFNPTTRIGFTLKVSGFTTLKIYDALGREVSVPVNEHRESGRYSIDFDASKMASGIYFYKLTSGSFTQTKKMLMVK